MAEKVQRIEYFYTIVPNKAGAGAAVLDALKGEGVNLIAFLGFPVGWGRAQLDFVPYDKDALLAAARKANIKIVGPRTAFLIQGDDRAGAVADTVNKLKQAQINITAMQAVASGEGRYGAILWVKPKDLENAAKALGVS
jgi:hypothetical protein